MGTKINVGCGRDYREGWINIDKSVNSDCDFMFDMESKNAPEHLIDKADIIIANNLLCMCENTVNVMNNLWFMCAKNGIVELLTFDAGKYPHLFFQDPCHKKGLSRDTYSYFNKDEQHYKEFGTVYGFKPWEIFSIDEVGQCLKVIMTPVK